MRMWSLLWSKSTQCWVGAEDKLLFQQELPNSIDQGLRQHRALRRNKLCCNVVSVCGRNGKGNVAHVRWTAPYSCSFAIGSGSQEGGILFWTVEGVSA